MTITVTRINSDMHIVASDGYTIGNILKSQNSGIWSTDIADKVEFHKSYLAARNHAFKAGNRIEERSKSPEVTAAAGAAVADFLAGPIEDQEPIDAHDFRVEPTPKAQPIKPYAVRGKRADRLAFRPFRYGVQLALVVLAAWFGA